LRDRIREQGSLSVEAYMEACNTFYYATRDPLGAAGDFTTAPEISQMFGELVGAALADTWIRAGRPADARYVELGPGRGTLAADALRAMRAAGLDPPIDLVETSPLLRSAQQSVLPGARWHDDLSTVPDAPILLVGNEFLDALPVQQWIGGKERRVIVAGGGLAFDRDGPVHETAPAREAVVAELAGRLVRSGGAALLIDYGHDGTGSGDTLQAVRAHTFAPVLADPGEQDLTAHVDFGAVARAASAAGARVTDLVPQGEWLRRLGIEARARSLGRANPEKAPAIDTALRRLAGADEMGELFKVIGITSPDWPVPAGLTA
jgi:NADH dehydrogenase [ubiquinone] 1 alpha subcomplex assembly factor 7